MLGWDFDTYAKRAQAFGWNTMVVVDGHNIEEIAHAYKKTLISEKPSIIIARTVKGKGVSFLEDKPGFHGKVLSEEDLQKALTELGEIDTSMKGEIVKP
jgi:transketolase